MAFLTTPHERALTLLFSELESAVSGQREAFVGTPGSLDERTNENGTRFWVRRYSDAAGRRLETYLGKADDESTRAKVEALRHQIDSSNSVISQVRLLARAGRRLGGRSQGRLAADQTGPDGTQTTSSGN